MILSKVSGDALTSLEMLSKAANKFPISFNLIFEASSFSNNSVILSKVSGDAFKSSKVFLPSEGNCHKEQQNY